MLNIELSRLLRRIRNPLLLVSYILFLAKKILFRITLNKIDAINFYPSKVRKKYDDLDRRVYLLEEVNDYKFFKKNIRLASGYFVAESEDIWSQEFTDLEDSASLHRWNWLIYSVSKSDVNNNSSSQWGWSYIRSWIRINGIGKSQIQLEPYTIGERLVNVCIYANLINRDFKLPGDISSSIELMAYKLSDSLEYKTRSTTGNHVFNNARGLYFAGVFLGNSLIIDLAVSIFKDRIKSLVTIDGFFSEGSSHYHLLFTRWVFEIVWLANQINHKEVILLLQPYLNILLNRSNFFMIYNKNNEPSIPLIGDISPDFPPEWLFSVAHVEFKKEATCNSSKQILPIYSWHNLFFSNIIENTSFYKKQLNLKSKAQSFPKSFWHRFDWNKWTLFFHAVPGNHINQAGHFHEDLTGFVLFYDGDEIFIDTGRKNYRPDDDISNIQKSSLGHNSVLVNGLGPGLMPNQQKYPKFYKYSKVEVDFEISDKCLSVNLKHTGFTRGFSNIGEHIREFYLSDKGFEIKDKIDGMGKVNLSEFFYLSSFVEKNNNVKEKPSEMKFKLRENNYCFRYIGSGENMVINDLNFNKNYTNCMGSNAYGESHNVTSFEMEAMVDLPFQSHFQLIQN